MIAKQKSLEEVALRTYCSLGLCRVFFWGKTSEHIELWTLTDTSVDNKTKLQTPWSPSFIVGFAISLPRLLPDSLSLSLSPPSHCGAWGRRCNEDECLRLAANAERYTWLRARGGEQRLFLKTSQIGRRRSGGLWGPIHQQHTCLLCTLCTCTVCSHICIWATFNTASRL